MGEDWYRAQGIDIVDVDRGGKVTYHGPGQLVGYPIVAIGDVMEYVALLERAIVAALDDEGIVARGRSAEGIAWTGVWTEDRKIASIGLHVSQGVTKHGFAVNVDNSLEPFGWIVPCGLPEVSMTSVAAEASEGGRDSNHLPCFRKRVAWRFAQAHGSRQRLVSRARLEAALERTPAGQGSALSLAR
jgi:lipoyl(octanoyl) transferase